MRVKTVAQNLVIVRNKQFPRVGSFLVSIQAWHIDGSTNSSVSSWLIGVKKVSSTNISSSCICDKTKYTNGTKKCVAKSRNGYVFAKRSLRSSSLMCKGSPGQKFPFRRQLSSGPVRCSTTVYFSSVLRIRWRWIHMSSVFRFPEHSHSFFSWSIHSLLPNEKFVSQRCNLRAGARQKKMWKS